MLLLTLFDHIRLRQVEVAAAAIAAAAEAAEGREAAALQKQMLHFSRLLHARQLT